MPAEIVRYIKSNINKLAITLFIYELIFQIGTGVFLAFGEALFQNEYFAMTVCSSLALLSTFLILGIPKSPETERESLTLRTFLIALFLMYGLQTIATYLTLPLQAFLNSLGYGLSEAEEAASGGLLTDPLTVLYTVLAAPLFEELLFRGFLYGELRRFGKYLAIFTTAFLFALMHGNILQFFLALLIGMLLASVRERFGLRVSILLHAMNNGLALLFNNYVESSSLIFFLYMLLSYGGIAALGLNIFSKYETWKEGLQAERSFPYVLRYFFSSICMILLILAFLALTALNLN